MKFMVDNFLETILEILKQPKDHIRIELRNFGIFEVKPTKAKPKARNPRTNEEIFVPAHRKIMFKPGKNLKTELKKEWKIQLNRILAIDFGDVRVGLALSDLTCTISKPFKTINYINIEDLLNQIFEITKENQVNKIVVGIPYNMKGEDTKQTIKVREFVSALENKMDYKIDLIDERLTSSEAEKFMHQMNIKTGHNKDKIDKIAASIILQEYLDTI